MNFKNGERGPKTGTKEVEVVGGGQKNESFTYDPPFSDQAFPQPLLTSPLVLLTLGTRVCSLAWSMFSPGKWKETSVTQATFLSVFRLATGTFYYCICSLRSLCTSLCTFRTVFDCN